MRNAITCFLVLMLSQALAQETADTTLIINEVQVANLDQFLDNANCYGSWIELYNPTPEDISLKDFYLTDGMNEHRLLSTHGSVPAKGFKTLWFGHYMTEGNYGSKARQQIPFKLEPEGGNITLLNSYKSPVSSVSYPPAIPRCSWARTKDGKDTWGTTAEPTPEATNATSSFATYRLEEPRVDTDSRVFTEPFAVHVRIPTGCTLRYTTDGSAPSPSNGETSQNGRFYIYSTTVLRLCLFRKGYLPSPVVTRSYIYSNHPYYLPVLSICSEPKNFFDTKVGIFVKGTNGMSGNGQNSACNWNMDWERPVNIEYLVPEPAPDNGQSSMVSGQWSMALNHEADIEICGGWTRAYGGGVVDGRYWEARSSFRIKTDKRYEGVSALDYPVFPLKPHNKYRCWQVRNGGNDTKARIKDPAIQQIVMRSGFYIDCQDYQPAHVFLNGEYYGMLNIRESNNKLCAYSNYGIAFYDMAQFDLSNAMYNQKVGDNQAWQQLQKLVRQLAQSRSPEVYSQVCNLLDIDEFINYMALECYMGPSDWITNNNNVKGFRSRSDGKFHFVLFDTDSAFAFDDMLTAVLNSTVSTNVDDLLRYLMKYEPFRQQFMDAFCIVDGSVFEPTRCSDIITEIYQNINPALAFEDSKSSLSLIDRIRSAYNGTRISKLRNYYNISYSLYATLSTNTPEARIALNGQEIPTGHFAGHLFSYKGMPIMLTAKAPAGYTFSGWQLEDGGIIAEADSLDLHEAFTSGSTIDLRALFTPITDEQQRWETGATPIRINELSAVGDIHINDYGKKADWIELYNTTDRDISLEGLYLSDDPNKPEKYQITADANSSLSTLHPSLLTVPAHGTRIIWCDGKESVSQLHAPFKLENADGAYVSIQAADGSWTDSLTYREQSKWQTFGRYPDGGNMASILNQPTIDKSNKIGMADYLALLAETNNPDAIQPTIATNKRIRTVQYLNLAGQQIPNPLPSMGIIIRKVIYEDDSFTVTKTIKTH